MSSQQFYSFTSSYTSSSNGGPPQTSAYAARSYGDDQGTITDRITKQPGQAPVHESFQTGQPVGRAVDSAAQESVQNRVEDVTDADREYEERIGDEYAKREGGA